MNTVDVLKGTDILFMSLRLRLAEPYHGVQWKLQTLYHAVWVLPSCFQWTRLYVIGWTIPCGYTRIERCPRSMELESILFHFFLHIHTDANMLCRLFDDRKYMDIYLPIHQEYCYLGNKKKQFVFSCISLWTLMNTCEYLWPSRSHLVNCAKCEQIPSKYVTDWSVWNVF